MYTKSNISGKDAVLHTVRVDHGGFMLPGVFYTSVDHDGITLSQDTLTVTSRSCTRLSVTAISPVMLCKLFNLPHVSSSSNCSLSSVNYFRSSIPPTQNIFIGVTAVEQSHIF